MSGLSRPRAQRCRQMTSLEGFGSGDAGQPGCRSSNVASCPRVTVIAPVSPADRARSGHASVEVAHYGLTSAPWSSSSPSELRITRVFPCASRGFKSRSSFMSAGCCWRRSLVVDGSSGTSRGHVPVRRRPRRCLTRDDEVSGITRVRKRIVWMHVRHPRAVSRPRRWLCMNPAWAHLPMARARRVLTAVSTGRLLRCTWASRSAPSSVASRVTARSSGSMPGGSFPSA